MQRHCQHHHGRSAQFALRPLGLIAAHMEVGDQPVEQEQKQHPGPKAGQRGEKRQPAHVIGLRNGGDQQAPYRGRHHHSGGKAGKRALNQIAQRLFHKEHAGSTQCCAEKGNQYSEKDFHLLHRLFVVFYSSPDLTGLKCVWVRLD